ncbi:hypothetical protein F5J12DRAFT_362826 [Pisolithus orientalis]|uniref:uncharacterized protein n=1 Tax=Pisolithus orientalis TaxID=936130 RepID=UPI002223EF9A|nr:uncharacterized protein F5J12DRAFT_362826 [Pisolithus orientalis]KAI5996003.1 hypothetical protein F5J12DRAFT_362826 [Pisolithus orientalis]
MQFAPTVCVEDVGSMGDVEDEGAEEGQSPPNSSRLFVSNKVRPGPDDNQRTRKRFSPSLARCTPLLLPGTTLAVEPSASASSSSLPAVSTSALATSSLVGNVVGASPTSTAMSRGRERRSTLEAWCRLRSFIDLRVDSEERVSSWKWRSFIEIGVA